MRFLFRLGFWLTVILVCLPSGGSQTPSKVNISAGEAISAATAGDVRPQAVLRPAARRLRGRLAGRGGARTAGAGRRQDALRVPQRACRAARDRNRGPSAAGKAVPVPPPKPSQNTLVTPDRSRRPGAARSKEAQRHDPTVADPNTRTSRVEPNSTRPSPTGLARLYLAPYIAYAVARDHPGARRTRDRQHRRHHRQLLPARRLGRPLSLCDRARPRACPAARARSHRHQQGAGLRQPGLARHHRRARRRRRPGAAFRRRQRRPYRARTDRHPVRDLFRQDARATSSTPTRSRCSSDSACASISRRSARTAFAPWSSASSRTPAARSRRCPDRIAILTAFSHSPTNRASSASQVRTGACARAARFGAVAVVPRQPVEPELQHDLGGAARPAALALDIVEPLEEAADVDQQAGEFRPDLRRAPAAPAGGRTITASVSVTAQPAAPAVPCAPAASSWR